MDALFTTITSLVIFASAAGLMVWHWLAWRGASARGLEPREQEYRWRQFRRRMQTSAMLGLAGVGLGFGRWLMVSHVGPFLITLYWLGILLLLVWIALLAIVDAWATHHHFDRLRHECVIEQAKLNAQLEFQRKVQSNGQAQGRPTSMQTDD
jgi:hypothetical protein